MSRGMDTRYGIWLESRLGDVPCDLAEAMRGAIDRVHARDGSTPAEALADVSVAELCSVTEAEQNRGAALRLLAADALLTYAFEAAVDPEMGGDAAAAERLAEQIGPWGYLGDCIGSTGDRGSTAAAETASGGESAEEDCRAS